MDLDLRGLIVRHRHVAPMVSALLAGTDAQVRILDADDAVVLARQLEPADPVEQRSPITAEGRIVGWVEGGRVAASIAGVLSYAYARELDKRTLAQEALDRYRELNLIYELAAALGAETDLAAITQTVVAEIDRLPGDESFLLLADEDGVLAAPPGGRSPTDPSGGIIEFVAAGEAEIVNDVSADARSSPAERDFAALIVAPLRGSAGSVGVIGRASRQVIEYRAGDLKVLSAVAALAGPAMDQARARGQVAHIGASELLP
jgi:adenylate cyclase